MHFKTPADQKKFCFSVYLKYLTILRDRLTHFGTEVVYFVNEIRIC